MCRGLTWSWSVLHEAASKLALSDDENAKAVKTFSALVDHCIAHHIRVDELPKKTDSRATAAHQVAYRGSKVAMESSSRPAGGSSMGLARDGCRFTTHTTPAARILRSRCGS